MHYSIYIANNFNDYFVSHDRNLNATLEPQNGIPVINIQPLSQCLANRIESSIYLYDTYDLPTYKF